MPELPVEAAGGGRYPAGMETRIALLEQIAQANTVTFARFERQIEALAREQQADFRRLLGIMLGGFSAMLGVMAHGFHRL